MPVPKQRHTKSRRDKRRSHQALKKRQIFICPKCARSILPHQVCLNCGFYKGREVIDVMKKLTKKERKQKEKEMAAQEKEQVQGAKSGKNLDMEEMSRKI